MTRSLRTGVIAVAALAASFALTACGSDDAEKDAGADTSASATPGAGGQGCGEWRGLAEDAGALEGAWVGLTDGRHVTVSIAARKVALVADKSVCQGDVKDMGGEPMLALKCTDGGTERTMGAIDSVDGSKLVVSWDGGAKDTLAKAEAGELPERHALAPRPGRPCPRCPRRRSTAIRGPAPVGPPRPEAPCRRGRRRTRRGRSQPSARTLLTRVEPPRSSRARVNSSSASRSSAAPGAPPDRRPVSCRRPSGWACPSGPPRPPRAASRAAAAPVPPWRPSRWPGSAPRPTRRRRAPDRPTGRQMGLQDHRGPAQLGQRVLGVGGGGPGDARRPGSCWAVASASCHATRASRVAISASRTSSLSRDAGSAYRSTTVAATVVHRRPGSASSCRPSCRPGRLVEGVRDHREESADEGQHDAFGDGLRPVVAGHAEQEDDVRGDADLADRVAGPHQRVHKPQAQITARSAESRASGCAVCTIAVASPTDQGAAEASGGAGVRPGSAGRITMTAVIGAQ
ncbi:hypothetical protein SBADM41S_10326 [Streptomyces badius]